MDDSAAPIMDGSGGGRNFPSKNMTGSPTYSQPGKFGTAIDLTGDSIVKIYESPDYVGGFNLGTSFCFLMWFKSTSSTPPGSESALSNSDQGLNVRTYDSRNGGVRVGYNGGTWIELTTDEDVYLEDWVHIATFQDGTNLKLFINGVQTDTRSGSGDPEDKTTASVGMGSDGLYDDVALFYRAPSSTEINDIMDNGLVGGGSPVAQTIYRYML